MTIRFKAHEWFNLKDRGRVAVVTLHRTYDNANDLLPDLQAQGVEIDGDPYRVIGVEKPATMSLCAGWGIGLLVERQPVKPAETP